MRRTLISLALILACNSTQAEVEWLDYDADSDIEMIEDAVALGTGPDLMLKTESLEGARILYGNPIVIEYKDGSTLTLKRYTETEIEQEFGHKLNSKNQSDTIRATDVPSIMLQYNLKPGAMEFDNKALIKELQTAGKRLLKPLANRSERFFTRRYGKELWFVLGEQESIGFITHAQLPDQYVMVRAQNMPKSDFLARVIRGALQPQGSEWSDEDRKIPQQHMIPLPK